MKKQAILLISCPDRKGIVAVVSDFLYKHGANILHADQHQDNELNLFFMRIEWDLADFNLTKQEFCVQFIHIANEFKMNWRFVLKQDYPKAAIFVSSQDHCLADLLYRHKNKELHCDIRLIISNHANTKELADFYHIPFFEIRTVKQEKKAFEKKSLVLLKKYNIDLVVLARYMQILSPHFIEQYPSQIINIHHSFLPAFIGSKPYHQAYDRGVKIIGATSHYVTEQLDKGPIIEQDVIRINHTDTVSDFIQKGRDLEKVILSRAIRWHSENKILVYANKTVVFN